MFPPRVRDRGMWMFAVRGQVVHRLRRPLTVNPTRVQEITRRPPQMICAGVLTMAWRKVGNNWHVPTPAKGVVTSIHGGKHA